MSLQIKLVKILLFIGVSFPVFAQYRYAPLSTLNQYKYEFNQQKDSSYHDAVWPKFRSQLDTTQSGFLSPSPNSWLGRKVFTESLLRYNTKNISVTINPVVSAGLGRDLRDEDTLSNNLTRMGRGFYMEGQLGKRVSFYTIFEGTQQQMPLYVDNYIESNQAFPSIGEYKGDLGELRDWFYNVGAVSVHAAEWLDITLGQGRNFIGSGHRSMLLSDNAAPYPYLKLETTVGPFKYINLYTQMSNVEDRKTDIAYQAKWNVMHYLSWNISDKVNVNIFESITWSDSTNNNNAPLALFNPIVFYRPVEFSLGSRAGNVMLGIGANWKIGKNKQLYGQLAIDEFRIQSILGEDDQDWANKVGLQLGLKGTEMLSDWQLFYRAEFNAARPYMYAHRDIEKGYAHFNQSIAHTLGGNFYEGIAQVRLSRGRLYANLQGIYAQQGLDGEGQNWGSSVRKSYNTRERDSGNYVGQGITANRVSLTGTVGYVVNPQSQLCLELQANHRSVSFPSAIIQDHSSTQLSLTLRSALFRQYTDF